MTELNFTLPDGIRLMARPDASGRKCQTIRLLPKGDGLGWGDVVHLVDTRQHPFRLIGTARCTSKEWLRLTRDECMLYDRHWTWKSLGPTEWRDLAILDGFRGPDPGAELRRALEGFYIHGRGMTFPLDLVIIRWDEFVQDPDYAFPGEQQEMFQ